ncbi:MAG TPA: cytochrome c biogenesis protein CcsA [Verrucomicrobiae bacterium]|nr:cytochrome c biogenesis protein CcsA [Verrucomicrobiae bacterium]
MFWSDRTSFLIAVLFYGLSTLYSIFLFRRGFREATRITYFLLFGGFVFHTAAMILRGFRYDRCPIHNLYEATLFAEWMMLAIYLVVGLWSRLRFLGAFASPFLFGISVFALMPQLDQRTEITAREGWLSFHVALFALAYGAFGLSCVAGIMYLTQERDLKFHKFRAVLSLMPPLQRLELVAGRLLLGGLVLWTSALMISAVLARQLGNVKYLSDPKILWSFLVWGLYLALVIMRWRFAQGGRRFAAGAVGTFVFVLLTYWGASLLSPIHAP